MQVAAVPLVCGLPPPDRGVLIRTAAARWVKPKPANTFLSPIVYAEDFKVKLWTFICDGPV